MDPLAFAAWQAANNYIAPEGLPQLAVDALLEGRDGHSLRLLAGASPNDIRDNRDLLVQALEELSIEAPENEVAWWHWVREKTKQVASGELDPLIGGGWLTWAHWETQEGDLRIFAGLMSEYDDHPRAGHEIGLHIVEESRALLERPRLRVWLRLQALEGESVLRHSNTFKPVSMDSLGLDKQLQLEVLEWSDDFIATTKDDVHNKIRNPAQIEVRRALLKRGSALAEAISSALGEDWHVESY